MTTTLAFLSTDTVAAITIQCTHHLPRDECLRMLNCVKHVLDGADNQNVLLHAMYSCLHVYTYVRVCVCTYVLRCCMCKQCMWGWGVALHVCNLYHGSCLQSVTTLSLLYAMHVFDVTFMSNIVTYIACQVQATVLDVTMRVLNQWNIIYFNILYGIYTHTCALV